LNNKTNFAETLVKEGLAQVSYMSNKVPKNNHELDKLEAEAKS
jgi:endonuclease YncB( thermonuclease family)